MSIDALKWAKDMPLGKDYSAKFVLFMLANYANEEQRCFPSVASLRSDTSMADKTIRNAIKRLEGHGLVQCERVRRNNGSLAGNRYRLVLDRTSPLVEGEPASVGESSQTQDVVGEVCGKSAPAVPGAAGETSDQPPVSEASPPVSEGAPPVSGTGLIDEPSIEPPIEPSTLRESAQARAPNDEGSKPDGATSGDTTSGGDETGERKAKWLVFRRKWPNADIDDMVRAKAVWDGMPIDQLDAATNGIGPYFEALNRKGRTKALQAANYLKQAKWRDLEGKPDAGGKYVPLFAKVWSPLWMASLIERVRTGDAWGATCDLNRIGQDSGRYLRFGAQRDAELRELSKDFEKVATHHDRWTQWQAWLEREIVANPQREGRMSMFVRQGRLKPLSNIPVDQDNPFWLSVPSDAMAKAWGIELELPSADAHPPPSDIDAADAFN